MKMKINSKDFRVREAHEVNLRKWLTNVEPVYKSKEHYHKLLADHVAQLSSLQQLLYASNRYAALLIFQAMDAAGKDGAIKHVMSGVNPQGCQVFSFKHPSPAELQHDFLWRTTRELPERGRIGIFNRSYYEEVLIVRVHREILRGEGLPGAPHDEEAVWLERYRSIANLERHLHDNGTRIMKFYLHLSKEEQRKRFLQRIDQHEKNWKISTHGQWGWGRAREETHAGRCPGRPPTLRGAPDRKTNAAIFKTLVTELCWNTAPWGAVVGGEPTAHLASNVSFRTDEIVRGWYASNLTGVVRPCPSC
jgi:PPK2 family polyphosphate:nucleotide phosphotransferase